MWEVFCRVGQYMCEYVFMSSGTIYKTRLKGPEEGINMDMHTKRVVHIHSYLESFSAG